LPSTDATDVGESVALFPDGDTVLIGAPADSGSRGAAVVFVRSGRTCTQQGKKLTTRVGLPDLLRQRRRRVWQWRHSPARSHATCRHLRLTLHGAIEAGRKRASSASGTLKASFRLTLPHALAAGSAHATVRHGSWKVSLVLPGVSRESVAPSYLITVHYSGDRTHRPASIRRRIRLESELTG
jgi:hypothetical protein